MWSGVTVSCGFEGLALAYPGKVSVLMDGGFVVPRLRRFHNRHARSADVRSLASDILDSVPGASLYRVLYYDADPYEGTHKRPLSSARINFSTTPLALHRAELLRRIELSRDFAVRRGELVFRGWRLRSQAQARVSGHPPPPVSSNDFVPHFVQKGVDMRIGLDIAALALKRLVDTVVLVTGDADLAPAMRFARREGLRVGLCPLGFEGVRPELPAHADFIVDWPGAPDPAGPSPSSPEDPSAASPPPTETRW